MLRSARDVALLILVAAVMGLVLARLAPARSAPAPAPTPTPVVESPTPEPTEPPDDDRVWQQPLVAGCALANGEIYLVSAGGGLARFDGKHWGLIDETLRQLNAVTCVSGNVLAVGNGGRFLRVDPAARTIRPDTLAEADLYAVSALDARTVWAAGSDQIVMRLTEGAWSRVGSGGGVAWRAVLARSPSEVWLAGDAGQLYVFDGKTFVDRSIPDGPGLTALASLGTDTLVGAADGRLFTVAPGRAAQSLTRVGGSLRGFAPAAGGLFLLADELREVTASAQLGPALAHGLVCPAVAVFGSGRELFVIGRDGTRAGLAHFDGSGWTKVGRC